jgi:hypothetical protein
MRTAMQFSGTLAANERRRWFTGGWPHEWFVLWTVIPTTVKPGAPQVEWSVEVERSAATTATYWISIRNLTGSAVNIEARYAALNAE